MKKRIIALSFLLTLIVSSAAFGVNKTDFQRRMVDLSHSFEKGMPEFTDQLHFTTTKLTDYSSGELSYAFSMPEHIGTHVDAPAYFFPGRRTIDTLLPGELVGNAVVINVVEASQRNSDYALSLEELKQWERANGPIKKGTIVLLRTGWESKWFKPKEFLNKDKNGVLHFPGYSCRVVDYLANHRAVKALGTDTLSVDPGESTELCAHKTMLRAGKYVIEGLTNLEKLPPRGAIIVVGPLKIKGGTGAPARVFGWLP